MSYDLENKWTIWDSETVLNFLPQKAALADWKKVIKFGWWWWSLPVWCGQEQLKSLISLKWYSKITRMIQNNLLSSQTKFNQNQIKNTEVKKTALAGQLGWPKNIHSHIKAILCCSLPPISNFTQIVLRQVKKIRYWSALIGWSSRSKNSHSNSKLIFLSPILAPKPNLI